MKNLFDLAEENGSIYIISLGLTTTGKTIVTKSKLVFDRGFWHIENGGIKIVANEATLSSALLDTPANRKQLKATI